MAGAPFSRKRGESETRESVAAHLAHHHALDLHPFGRVPKRRAGGIRREQGAATRGLIDALESDLLAVDQRDHHLAVAGAAARLHHHPVPVQNPGVHHRIALHPEHEALAPAAQRLRHLQTLRHLQRLDGPTGGDGAEQGECSIPFERTVGEAHAAPATAHRLHQVRANQLRDVLVQGTPGLESHRPAELVEGGGLRPLAAPLPQAIEHCALHSGKRRIAHRVDVLRSFSTLELK